MAGETDTCRIQFSVLGEKVQTDRCFRISKNKINLNIVWFGSYSNRIFC